MVKIRKIKGRQVFDSRGNPTVEAEIFSDDGHYASAMVPLSKMPSLLKQLVEIDKLIKNGKN